MGVGAWWRSVLWSKKTGEKAGLMVGCDGGSLGIDGVGRSLSCVGVGLEEVGD